MTRILVTILLLVLAAITLSACDQYSTRCLKAGGVMATIGSSTVCLERGFKIIEFN